jgi:hypothetical protein
VARESVLDMLAEQFSWLERWLVAQPSEADAPGGAADEDRE